MALPAHIAIIMDGNGRWAQARQLPRLEGHREGVNRVLEISRACRELGVRTLTLYAFSTENWKRPTDEVDGLMLLLQQFLRSHQQELVDTGTRMRAIGDISRLPASVREEIELTQEKTKNLDQHSLNIALSYGGRAEILRAARSLAAEVQTGQLKLDEIDEQKLSDRLYTAGQPDPDLLIRTSGEQRISNFLLWQLAYAEMMFVPVAWPQFTRERLVECLQQYGQRERRFGMTGEQVRKT